jgi:hypothetical protein
MLEDIFKFINFSTDINESKRQEIKWLPLFVY